MSFRKSSVSYLRFRPTGPAPQAGSEAIWEAFRRNKISAESLGKGGQPAIGWIGGRHVLDLTFGWETNSFGGSILVAMRRDAVRVPHELRHAYQALAEDAYRTTLPVDERARPLSHRERTEAKTVADRQGMDEVARGHHRTIRQVPVLWDIPGAMVLAPGGSDESRSHLNMLFRESFGISLAPLGAGELAAQSHQGGRRAVDDMSAATFGVDPVDPGSPMPRPSWSAGDIGDILGNEFLIWLWWHAEAGESLQVDADAVTFLPERVLDLSCAWDTTGTTALRTDFPTRLREARRALASGKWPRRMGFTMECGGDSFRATIRGENLAIAGLALPRDEDAPKTDRESTERRIDKILSFERTVRRLFESFVRVRLGAGWDSAEREIAAWVHRDHPLGRAAGTIDAVAVAHHTETAGAAR
ncbi:MAG: hypothetical protein O2819_02665 [Planctomycetota bacterium]|nr:hypothetical protein [Planctomycetota bacterium]MDA1105777.1 hypothetical protein [Planctomycetota bacterium]